MVDLVVVGTVVVMIETVVGGGTVGRDTFVDSTVNKGVTAFELGRFEVLPGAGVVVLFNLTFKIEGEVG